MEFKQNVGVFTPGGQEVGHIDRVVIDPRTKAVTHIVVRKGFVFTEDKVVPIELIASATEDRITLREDAGDLQALPQFEEKHYVMSEEETARTISPPGFAPSVYWYPPLGSVPAGPEVAPGPKVMTQIEQNIPEGTVALKEGARAIAAGGKHVGNVERIFTGAQADRATHLLISKGLLLKERKLVPMTWVTIVGEDEVHLTVGPRLLEELSPYRD